MTLDQLTTILKRDLSIAEQTALVRWANSGQIAKRWYCFIAGLLAGALLAWIL